MPGQYKRLQGRIARRCPNANLFRTAPSAPIPEELADVLEVLRAIASKLKLDWPTIDALAAQKRSERGGFDTHSWVA